MKQLDSLDHQLAGLLGVRHVKKINDIHKLQRIWPDLCGQMMATSSEPVSVEDGCLWIAVNHPSLTAHIRMLQFEILSACSQKAGIRGLRKIRTRIVLHAGIKHQVPKKKTVHRLNLSQKKNIVRDLKNIRSHELRHAMFRARVFQEELQPFKG